MSCVDEKDVNDKETEKDNVTDSADKKNTFDIKVALPIFIAMILVGILFVKIGIPAMSPGIHEPTTVINQSGNGDYFNEVFGK